MPTQFHRNLILIATGLVGILTVWVVARHIRAILCGRETIHFAVIGFAVLFLACAADACIFLVDPEWIARNPGAFLALPICGVSAYLLGAFCDKARGISTGQGNVPHRRRKSRFSALLETICHREGGFKNHVMDHFSGVVGFYLCDREVYIESQLNLENAISRIKQIGEKGEVSVRLQADHNMTVYKTHPNRLNVIPLFKGRLCESGGKGVLTGQIGLEPGIRIGIGFFVVLLFIILPIRLVLNLPALTIKDVIDSAFIILGLLMLLELCYLVGKDDAATIVRNLEATLKAA